MKKCPFCSKDLPEEMQFCPYCMQKLVTEQPVTKTPEKKRPLRWTIILVGAVAIVVVIALVVYGLGSSWAPSQGADSSTTTTTAATTTTTTTTTKAQNQVITVMDVKETINSLLGKIDSVTDEMMVKEKTVKDEGDQTVYSLSYMQGKCLVTVHVKEGVVTQILSGTIPSQFYIKGENTEVEATALATSFVGMPLMTCYKDGDMSHLFANLFKSTPEKTTVEGTTTELYTYEDGSWQYILTVSNMLITAGAKPIETSEPSDSVEPDDTTALTEDTTAEKEPVTTTKKDTASSKATTAATKKTTAAAKKTAAAAKKTTMTGAKTTTTTTKATTTQSPTEADPCDEGHAWEEITETVEHEEVGHYEETVVDYRTITLYKCAVCYNTFESQDAYYTHFAEHEKTSDSLVAAFRDRYETETKKEPIYENQWIVDEEAYTEDVVVGRKCRVCGKTE